MILPPKYSRSLPMTSPHHLSLPSLISIPNRSTPTVLPMHSFPFPSLLVTPIANLNIFISTNSISFTYFPATATVPSPHTTDGPTTELYTFPSTPAGNLLSQVTPGTPLHPLHSARTLLFTSLSQPPPPRTVDPKYPNSSTPRTSVSSIFTASSPLRPFMHRYSVFDPPTFIPLPSNAHLQDFSLRSTSSPVSPQITILSATASSMVGLFPISSVSPSTITANRNDPTLIPGVVQP